MAAGLYVSLLVLGVVSLIASTLGVAGAILLTPVFALGAAMALFKGSLFVWLAVLVSKRRRELLAIAIVGYVLFAHGLMVAIAAVTAAVSSVPALVGLSNGALVLSAFVVGLISCCRSRRMSASSENPVDG